MKTEFLNNRGINLFKDELETKMLSSDGFNIATAFITSEAIEIIKLFLHKNKNRKGIGRLITGFYNCFNSQEVLMDLQSLAKNSKGRLLVSISTNERFHWKYYHFESNLVETAYIGSANFTAAGLSSEGEIISKLTLSAKNKSEKQNLKKIFNAEFENAIDIGKFPLEEYRQSKFVSLGSGSLPASIKEILNSKNQIQSKNMVLRETAEKYDKSGELYPDDFETALKNVLHSDSEKQQTEAEIRSIIDDSDDLKPNPVSMLLKRLRIESGLSIEELSQILDLDIEALESGKFKLRMRLKDIIRVLKYLTKDK